MEEPAPTEIHTDTVPPIARNASWGAIVSIVVILLMITVGAFYAWGQRLDQIRAVRAIEKANTQP